MPEAWIQGREKRVLSTKWWLASVKHNSRDWSRVLRGVTFALVLVKFYLHPDINTLMSGILRFHIRHWRHKTRLSAFFRTISRVAGMFAVIETGGKQYRVEEGERLAVEKLDVEVGAEVEFDRVLMVSNGEAIKVGTPLVEGASVKGKVVEQGRRDKIRVIKFKRRKHYLRRKGHRQHFTAVQIVEITH